MGKTLDLASHRSALKPESCYIIATSSWISYLITLHLSFLGYEMEIMGMVIVAS